MLGQSTGAPQGVQVTDTLWLTRGGNEVVASSAMRLLEDPLEGLEEPKDERKFHLFDFQASDRPPYSQES